MHTAQKRLSLMPELQHIKSLAMLKMEKNFRAHMEKNYPRNPYEVYTLYDLLGRLQEEVLELIGSCAEKDVKGAKSECADVSNIVDFIFERLVNGRIQ